MGKENMGKSIEVLKVAYQTGTEWGAVTVVELFRPAESLAKAVVAPYPVMTLSTGIWVPDRRGEYRSPDGTRFHQIDWKYLITGGCRQYERRELQAHNVTTAVIPMRDNRTAYHNLLLGRGFLHRK